MSDRRHSQADRQVSDTHSFQNSGIACAGSTKLTEWSLPYAIRIVYLPPSPQSTCTRPMLLFLSIIVVQVVCKYCNTSHTCRIRIHEATGIHIHIGTSFVQDLRWKTAWSLLLVQEKPMIYLKLNDGNVYSKRSMLMFDIVAF